MNQDMKDNYLDKLIVSVYPVHSEYTFYCSVGIERTCKISEVQLQEQYALMFYV